MGSGAEYIHQISRELEGRYEDCDLAAEHKTPSVIEKKCLHCYRDLIPLPERHTQKEAGARIFRETLYGLEKIAEELHLSD